MSQTTGLATTSSYTGSTELYADFYHYSSSQHEHKYEDRKGGAGISTTEYGHCMPAMSNDLTDEERYEELNKLVLELSHTVLGKMHPDSLRTIDNTVKALGAHNHPEHKMFQAQRRSVRKTLESYHSPPEMPDHTLDDEEDFDREIEALLESRTERLRENDPETYQKLEDFAEDFVPRKGPFSTDLVFGLVTFDCRIQTGHVRHHVLFDPRSKKNYIFRNTLSKMHPDATITNDASSGKEIRPHPTSKPFQVIGQTTLKWTFSVHEPFRETEFTVLDGPQDGIVFSFQLLLENFVFRNKYAGVQHNKKGSKRQVDSTDEWARHAALWWILILILLAASIFLLGVSVGTSICVLLCSVLYFKGYIVRGENEIKIKTNTKKQISGSQNRLDPADLDAEFYDTDGKAHQLVVRLDNSNVSGVHLVNMGTVEALKHEIMIDRNKTISLTAFSEKLVDHSLGEVQLSWKPAVAKSAINLPFHVLKNLMFEVILDAGWCRENRYLLYNPGAIAAIFRQHKKQTREQITAQENKKADLEAKRAKEKEEVTLSEQDIVDAYMLNVTRNVNNHTAGRSNPRFDRRRAPDDAVRSAAQRSQTYPSSTTNDPINPEAGLHRMYPPLYGPFFCPVRRCEGQTHGFRHKHDLLEHQKIAHDLDLWGL